MKGTLDGIFESSPGTRLHEIQPECVSIHRALSGLASAHGAVSMNIKSKGPQAPIISQRKMKPKTTCTRHKHNMN